MKQPNFWKDQPREMTVLDPVDRTAEVLFGLIMLLTCKGNVSVTSANKGKYMNFYGWHWLAILTGDC